MYDQYDEGMNMYDDGGNYYHKGSRKNRKRKRKLQQEESFIVDIEQRYIQAKQKKNKRLNTSSSSTTVSTNDVEVGTSSGKWNDDKNNVDKNVNNDIKKKKKKKKKKLNNTNKSVDNYNNNNKKKKKNNGITFQPLKKGIQYFDFKIGNGEAIKRGKKIEVKYIGRLTNHNGKVFDQGNIKFRVGSGEVIHGWDIGIIGMKLNGKRRLLIPPKCGYGRHKQSGIPGNSTLCFDVSILKIM